MFDLEHVGLPVFVAIWTLIELEFWSIWVLIEYKLAIRLYRNQILYWNLIEWNVTQVSYCTR